MYLAKLQDLLDKKNVKTAQGFHDYLRQNGLYINYHTANKYFKGEGDSLTKLDAIFRCFDKKMKFTIK